MYARPTRVLSRCLGMENRFCVEAKTFLFSVEEGKSVLRLEERRKCFTEVVLLDSQCIA
jgi:hypothetical protein